MVSFRRRNCRTCNLRLCKCQKMLSLGTVLPPSIPTQRNSPVFIKLFVDQRQLCYIFTFKRGTLPWLKFIVHIKCIELLARLNGNKMLVDVFPLSSTYSGCNKSVGEKSKRVRELMTIFSRQQYSIVLMRNLLLFSIQ